MNEIFISNFWNDFKPSTPPPPHPIKTWSWGKVMSIFKMLWQFLFFVFKTHIFFLLSKWNISPQIIIVVHLLSQSLGRGHDSILNQRVWVYVIIWCLQAGFLFKFCLFFIYLFLWWDPWYLCNRVSRTFPAQETGIVGMHIQRG